MTRSENNHGTVRSYSVGFGLSIILTLVAYYAGTHTIVHGWTLLYGLAALAIAQLFVQLVFFLHLSRGSESRWNRTALSFAAMVVAILVFGSLWIMKNLSYDHEHLPSSYQNQVIVKDEGYQPSNH